MNLRPTQVVLLCVFALALSLAGVPFFLGNSHEAALPGVVVDARGFGVADAAVFLFEEQELRLVGETRTDEGGDFEFPLAPEGSRVFVRPARASGLLSAWSPSRAEVHGRVALVLHPVRTLEVCVRDVQGTPQALAEVRVYEQRGEPAVLSTARTDADGRARLPAPQRAHVAVVSARDPHLMRWRFDLEVPQEGRQLELMLPPGRMLEGVVRGPEGPLSGIVLVSWEEGTLDGWNGFTHSDGRGSFELPRTDGVTLVRVLDPSGVYLPVRLRSDPASASPLEIELQPGAPQVVRTTSGGFPLEAYVWSWSPDSEVWSWGMRSSASGRSTVPVAQRFSIRAEPLDPAFAAMDAWDLPFRSETLRLEALPNR